MSRTFLARVGVVVFLAAALLSGISLGRIVGARDVAHEPVASTPPVEPVATDAPMPDAEVAGEDFASLPRYPGSVRTAYEVFEDGRFRLTAAEYVTSGSLRDARVFYQAVIVDHGWERVDISYDGGEWAYVLLRGADEALIELEERAGLVEIDLQLSTPITGGAPALPEALPATPPPAAPAPPAPAAPPPPAPPAGDDDGDDGDHDGTDDDGSDD